MSLDVPTALLERAQQGKVDDQDFIDCIKSSLPYAWSVVTELVHRTKQTGEPFASDNSAPPSDQAQGQLLRMMASDAMRAAIQQHYGVRIAFQNCCKVGVFTPSAGDDLYHNFVSPRAQLLNQAPELVNC